MLFKACLHQYLKTQVVLPFTRFVRNLNSNTASVCKVHRSVYARTYPTILVFPDGSTINIRYPVPRRIIKLPLDLSTLSEEQQKIRLQMRKPIEEVKVEEELEDDFDPNKYI